MGQKLEELLLENVPDVLNSLKRYWPSSIHIYYFIQVQHQWLNVNPNIKSLKIYHYSDSGDELYVVVVDYQVKDLKLLYVMIHPVMKDKEKMKQLLIETDAIDWSSTTVFEGVFEKDIPIIQEVCKTKNKKCYSDGIFNQVWLPPEKQNNLNLIVPPDLYIEDLSEKHVSSVNDTWNYKSTGSEQFVRNTIVYNKGIGLFRKSDDKLLAWNTMQHFGALGMLYTIEDERGKGYGKLATLALAKHLVNVGIDPYACIKVSNAQSMAVYNKLGFEISDRVTWLLTSKANDALKEHC